jgi:hypothetical protein
MAKAELPQIEDIRNRVSYEPETGQLTWLPRPVSDFSPTQNETAEVRCRQWNSRCAGKPAFATINALGYCVGHFRAKLLAAHRVAFAIINGRWPSVIDHINGDRSDNRLCNLREVTQQENTKNSRLRSDSRTGRTGVRPNPRKAGTFTASIKINGRTKHLGTFATIEAAIAAREAAERQHGYSERHGRALPER